MITIRIYELEDSDRPGTPDGPLGPTVIENEDGTYTGYLPSPRDVTWIWIAVSTGSDLSAVLASLCEEMDL